MQRVINKLLNSAELALERGDYNQCLKFLEPLSQEYPLPTQEGARIRILMITAWMGKGNDQEAIAICRLLSKTKDPSVRQQAKQLLTILEAPNLPRPSDWSIQIPRVSLATTLNGNSYRKVNKKDPRDESIQHPPTGPTKAFDIGFFAFLIAMLLSLTFFSGL